MFQRGGGVVIRDENMKNLQTEGSTTIHLNTSFNTALERIGDRSSRPLLRDLDRAQELYRTRLPMYESYADLTFKTDKKAYEEITKEILAELTLE